MALGTWKKANDSVSYVHEAVEAWTILNGQFLPAGRSMLGNFVMLGLRMETEAESKGGIISLTHAERGTELLITL